MYVVVGIFSLGNLRGWAAVHNQFRDVSAMQVLAISTISFSKCSLGLRGVQERLVETSHRLEAAEARLAEHEALPGWRQYRARCPHQGGLGQSGTAQGRAHTQPPHSLVPAY